jgi:hypothetical protein
MRIRSISKLASVLVVAGLAVPRPARAFLEDLCTKNGKIQTCIRPFSACKEKKSLPNRACPAQVVDFAVIPPGRSMIHADSTYFLAQALGYRADVAYWIAAYNEVEDYASYAPIDQCGGQATSTNSGSAYITAAFNGFQRTNAATGGPLYHYVVNYSPNGAGTDVHGAGGVQSAYPFHYPTPGYPARIDDIYQGTLYNQRQWAMQPGGGPGLLCTAGFTVPNGASNFSGSTCLASVAISGTVPAVEGRAAGAQINVQSGPKVLDNSNGTVLYDQLASYLNDKTKTQGTLWLAPTAPPVPVQVARIGLYLHTLQDTASHSTFCGDDAPSPPGGSDVGTFMSLGSKGVQLSFGTYCATGPHIAGHVQETGTGDQPLPLRDYVALNMTIDELILFGNTVAKPNGWIVNPQLLPPNVTGGKSAAGASAADLQAQLVGTIVSGQRWSRAEVYQSGAVTLPLQQTSPLDRLHAMNAALKTYSDARQAQTPAGVRFTPFLQMPGNSASPTDTSVCFK